MKWYLNSASGELLHKKNFFTKKLKENACKNMLVIAHQSSKGASRAYEIIFEQEPNLKEVAKLTLFDPQEYNLGKYKVADFDALYIKGGIPQKWDSEILAPCGEKINTDLKNFLFKKSGCYFGSSWGIYILFDSFHTHPEVGEEHLSEWYNHGLGIYRNITLDTHYSPPQDMAFLKKRQIETLKSHPEIKFGVLFSSDCVIEVDSEDITNWKILSGSYEVTKYYPEL